MEPYRILVVDDSVFMRKIITDLIEEDPNFRVVAVAKNGAEAVDKTKELKPHAVTMDIEMPEMNGLEALERIMAATPTPVIMLSSLTMSGAAETIRALELGAIDFIRKPSGSISLDLFKVKQLLHEKLRIAVKTRMQYQPPIEPAKRPERFVQPPAPFVKPSPAAEVPRRPAASPQEAGKPAGAAGAGGLRGFQHLVAIGTSTGGPRALQKVLSGLPADFPAPVLIVQHMPPNFTKSLSQRLNDQCAVRVVEAEEAQLLEAGTAYVAPGGLHMTVVRGDDKKYRISLSKSEPVSGHRPSVDKLFQSLLLLKELTRHAVIMTGMGSDGARTIGELRKDGAATTIAESEETCVVYGMPRVAVENGAAMFVLPLGDIAPKLVERVTDKNGSR
ncbi:chemotaxis response regulator protein-glutamate methylesterase [Paenibacillus sp. UNC499MF]|uniref:protein-glutamate methylesterase/protein-glutamine glutaminase n=1 Tax=Paenibacillus sp. UNC499MF TaxID=1502751 RepID=UPI00089FBE04|nr:chemotaxis response regulator protein-glutamate methylesterase [Paenibacillus sp. UNC499MF]SEF58449.1 two-component system, chemotaxis family, response regulator CheB [Paenibacillus sp. UNC499MF]